MFGADKGAVVNAHSLLDGKKLYIGIVQARFNAAITDALFQTCYNELLSLGVLAKHIEHITVPGALEIPVALQALAEQEKFDALIALGCIIRGETYHFELVANESATGITRIALDNQVPISNAVLTVENQQQAVARQAEKGIDAAKVAVEMANLLNAMA